ncbi:MAG: hypothetical protein WHS38_12290 [Thermodesulforhabdaceae bacterium]
MSNVHLERFDRVLLNRLQQFFPLVSEPFREIGKEFNVEPERVIERINFLKEHQILRQISAIFNTSAVGYKSSLVAVAVPDEDIERAAQIINYYPGVSHNYLRPAAFNLWFTIAVPPWSDMESVVENLVKEAGDFPFIILPALKKYKLAMVLDMVDDGDPDSLSTSDTLKLHLIPSGGFFDLSEKHIRIVRCVQEDLPLTERPFQGWAEMLNMNEQDLIEILQLWLKTGIIRRFAALLNHREAGFVANGMVVWNCPKEFIDEVGTKLASFPEVSHCYHRPSYPQWPYNLYAMIHSRTVEKCRDVAKTLSEAVNLLDYEVLFSVREFKKIRLKLFWEYSDKT